MNKEALRKELELRRAIKADTANFQDMLTQGIAKLEAQLAEAEKPGLRNWDIGTGLYNDLKWLKVDGKIFWIHGREGIDPAGPSECEESLFLDDSHINILDVLDDLKAQSRPLKGNEFYIDQTRCKLIGGLLCLGHVGSGWAVQFQAKALPEFILNLRRLLHTAELEASHE